MAESHIPAGNIAKVTDHGGPDPIQGYDVDVWVQRQDLITVNSPTQGDSHNIGGMVLLGSFTGIKVQIRTASEVYLEYDSRNPVYMDGETQILFTLEKGLIDMNVITETFGASVLGRRASYNVMPRFNITFNVNTVSYTANGQPFSELNSRVNYGQMPNFDQFPSNGLPGIVGQLLPTVGESAVPGFSGPPGAMEKNVLYFDRSPNGRFVLKNCKMDGFTIDAGAGKQVVATQWSGVADEIVSLAGDPPALKKARGETAHLQDGARDTVPTREADTTLPKQDIIARARQKAAKNITGEIVGQFTRGLGSAITNGGF